MKVNTSEKPPGKFSQRLLPVRPSPTLAITAKAKALRAEGKSIVNFAAGEPDFPVPTPAKEAMIRALNENFTRYTPTSGMPELKTAVCEKFKRDQKLDVKPDQVVISCGAKHALYNLMQVLVDPGDEVLIPCPYWVSYPEMVRLAGGNPVPVETSGNNFLMAADLIEKAITPKTRLVVLNSPSNPTGAVLVGDELRKIAGVLKRRGIFCITDEIYEYYVFDGLKQSTIASYLEDWKDRVAVVNGASKSYGMTGLRIGYTATHPEIAKKMGILQDHSTSNPDSVSQKGAIEALKLAEEYQAGLRETFEKRRDLISDKLEKIPGLKVERSQGSFYAFVSVTATGLDPAEFCRRLLEGKHVAVIPGEGFGSKTHVRVSYACSEKDILEGTSRISDFVRSLR